jgi:hypothetical protein
MPEHQRHDDKANDLREKHPQIESECLSRFSGDVRNGSQDDHVHDGKLVLVEAR